MQFLGSYTKMMDKCPHKDLEPMFFAALVINPKWQRATCSALGECKLAVVYPHNGVLKVGNGEQVLGTSAHIRYDLAKLKTAFLSERS